MRKSTLVLALLATGLGALALEAGHGLVRAGRDGPAISRMAKMSADLGLTDIALFSEARFVRHLSQADLFSPFQDAPMSFEHFPTGSLASPPRRFGPTGGFASTIGKEGGS